MPEILTRHSWGILAITAVQGGRTERLGSKVILVEPRDENKDTDEAREEVVEYSDSRKTHKTPQQLSRKSTVGRSKTAAKFGMHESASTQLPGLMSSLATRPHPISLVCTALMAGCCERKVTYQGHSWWWCTESSRGILHSARWYSSTHTHQHSMLFHIVLQVVGAGASLC